MVASSTLMEKLDALSPEVKDAMLCVMAEMEEKNKVIAIGIADFQELRDTVLLLATSQERLAKAQEEMSKSLNALIIDQQDMRKQLGGLAMNIGYGIEDKLIPKMVAAAKAEFGIEVSLVDRRNIIYNDGRYDEINIYCEGHKDNKPIYLIGEAKAQPGKKDFDSFIKVIERLGRHLQSDIKAFMVGYQYSPDVEIYADEHYPNIIRYKTFQLLKY